MAGIENIHFADPFSRVDRAKNIARPTVIMARLKPPANHAK
jgi:hypothetical protein